MVSENHPAVRMKGRGWDPFQPHSQRSNVIPFRRTPAPLTQVVDGVPVGTSVQIQEWVGDDGGRAFKVLERERGAERPRITLIHNMEAVLRRNGQEIPPAPQAAIEPPKPLVDPVQPPVVEPVPFIGGGDDDGALLFVEGVTE